MNPILRNVLAVIAGLVVGSGVNLLLVNLGPVIIPLPDGADVSTMEGLKESMPLFQPVNFLFPFLGHAVGTLAGAWVAARLAASHGMKLAMLLGVWFLFGGVYAARMLGGPTWFIATDLVMAYLPMAWFGGKLGQGGASD